MLGATDIAAGSTFEYKLLWVLLASNVIAVLLQTLAARLGIVTRASFPFHLSYYYNLRYLFPNSLDFVSI